MYPRCLFQRRRCRFVLRLVACLVLLFAVAPGPLQAQVGDYVFRDGFDVPVEGPANDLDASRFLAQATFGATAAEIARLRALGYHRWLDHQLTLPASLHRPLIADAFDQGQRQEAWMSQAVHAPDQLRQRVAFALSQIFVVGDTASALLVTDAPAALAHYYDLLIGHSFGNYRELLEEVTLSPAMGHYLSMFRSRRPDATLNIRPDENYAREIMQLFSIGLVELAADGSVLLDGSGTPIPTYGQDQVRGYAHLFTGWNFQGVMFPFQWDFPEPRWFEPMGPFAPYHDTDTSLLILGEVSVPAGPQREAVADLELALDSIAAHPNVGPFISRRLIQRLVTSNPSPQYLARVSAIWADDGFGQRGNLGVVVRAILLDPEARQGQQTAASTFGKLREPLLRLTHLFRALDARDVNGGPRLRFNNPERVLGQAALRSPSVFNFYLPDYAPPGPVADAGLVAPEFQISTASLLTLQTNDFEKRLGHDFRDPTDFFWIGYAFDDIPILVDVDPLLPLLANGPDPLLDEFDRLFMAGAMSTGMRQILRDYLLAGGASAPPPALGRELLREALYLLLTSPEYVVQR